MKPRTDQLRFMSAANGETILDAYLEAAEKGGRALGDLLSDLFESDGDIRTDVYHFRQKPSNAAIIQFRFGDYVDPEAGWVDVNAVGFTAGGDLVGPASSTNNNIAAFNGTTGKLLKDSGFSTDTDGTLAANSNTRLATQQAVKTYVDNRLDAVDAEVFKGAINCSANPNYPAASAGHVYRVSVAGKIGGASGINVEIGDRLECVVDSTVSGDHATVGANWWITQSNIDGAVTGPTSATSGNVPSFNGTSGKILQDSGKAAADLVTGPASVVASRVAIFSGTTGKALADGGKLLPSGALVGDTDAQTLASKSLPDTSTDIVGNSDATKKSGFSNDLVSAGQRRVLTVPNKNGVIFTTPLAATDVRPTLDLNLASKWGAPFIDNLTRATAGGYRTNNLGVLVATAVNEPVIDFSAGTALGTGFYAAYTNFVLRSQEFDNAAWSKWGTTPGVITANNVTAPDGTLTADRFVGSAADCGFSQALSGFTIGDVVTASVWMRADSPTTVNLYIIDGGNSFVACSLTTEWQRFDVTRTLTTTTPQHHVGGAGTLTSKTVYVWGAQLTKTAAAVPYVPTTSATVTRNADVMMISGTDFTDFFNPLEGTFLVSFNAIPRSSHLFHITRGLGTYGPRLQCAINSSGYAGWAVVDDASATVADLVSAATVTTSGVMAMSYKVNEFNVCLNGGTVVSDVSGAVPTGLVRLEIGRAPDGGGAANGNIRSLTYWPKALTATELQRTSA